MGEFLGIMWLILTIYQWILVVNTRRHLNRKNGIVDNWDWLLMGLDRLRAMTPFWGIIFWTKHHPEGKKHKWK